MFCQRALFDACFFELDVFTCHRIVFFEHHLFRDIARIFLGHVVVSGACGALELDLDDGGFSHFFSPCCPRGARLGRDDSPSVAGVKRTSASSRMLVSEPQKVRGI